MNGTVGFHRTLANEAFRILEAEEDFSQGLIWVPNCGLGYLVVGLVEKFSQLRVVGTDKEADRIQYAAARLKHERVRYCHVPTSEVHYNGTKPNVVISAFSFHREGETSEALTKMIAEAETTVHLIDFDNPQIDFGKPPHFDDSSLEDLWYLQFSDIIGSREDHSLIDGKNSLVRAMNNALSLEGYTQLIRNVGIPEDEYYISRHQLQGPVLPRVVDDRITGQAPILIPYVHVTIKK